MLKELFNPANYFFNPFTIPMFISGIFLFIVAFFIWLQKKDWFGLMYFVWMGTGAIFWLISRNLVFMTRTSDLVVFIHNKIVFSGVAFISVHGYFVSLLWHREFLKSQRKYLILGYIIMAIFYIFNLFYNTVCNGVYEYSWGRYPRYTLLGFIFVCLWSIYFIATTINYYRIYTISSGFKRQQHALILIAHIVAYIGAADYLPCFGLGIYPFGCFPIILYFFIMSYAIIRYRVFEIDTVIHRTILWLLTILILIMPVGLIHSLLRVWMSRLAPTWIIIMDTLALIAFLGYYNRLRPKIDHLFRRRKYDYYQVLSEIGEKIGTELDINNIINRLFKELREVLYIRNGLVLVQQLGQEDYTDAGSTGYDKLQEEAKDRHREVLYNSNLSRWLNEHKKALEREQIEIDPQYEPIKEEALSWLNQNMLEILIPIVMEDRVNGLVGIGKKENLQAYTVKDIELLEKLGRQLGVTVDNALHHEDIVEKERLDEELKLGREIQMNLLPRQIPQVPNLSLQGLMTPAKEIGGDYYDFITLPKKEELAIVIGDVSGKGVAAGLLMSMVKATIHAFSQEETSPKQILLRTNQFLHQNIGGQKFMTLLYLKWRSQTRSLLYSSAGHEHILIYRVNPYSTSDVGEVEAIQSGGFMLGMMPDIEKFLEEREIKLNLGDKILLYTDGVTEAENQNGERFGLENLKEAFQRHSQKPAQELMQAVKDEVYSFIGTHPQYDDITLVVMEAV